MSENPTEPGDDELTELEIDPSNLGDMDEGTSFGVPSTDTLLGKAIYVGAVFTALLMMWQIMELPFTRVRYDNFHLLLVLLLFALIEVHHKGDPRSWSRRAKLGIGAFLVVMAAGIGVTLFVEANFHALQTEYVGYSNLESVIGGILIIATIVALYRAYGWMITAVAVISILYARYGFVLPGIFHHVGKSWKEIVALNVLQVNSGVYHLLFDIGATWIFVFIVWAGIVEELEGLETFFELGFMIGNRFKSGIAQTAVVSSMIMGSISGSPMANSVVTGSFTIPLMKKRGLAPKTAAAIESVASTGGMVLPPVMGTVAFLMTTFLNVSYGHIILVAALPAVLFYVAVALSVHLITVRLGLDISLDADIKPRETIKNFLPILASLIVLIYLLLGPEFSPGVAGVWTIISLVIAEFVKRLVLAEDRIASFVGLGKSVFDGLRTGTVRMVPISVTLAAIGVLITSFTVTGIGYRLSTGVVGASGGNIIILLALVMVTSIFLGMGMPTVAAYLLTISLIAPAMVQVGFEQITAHFFVFYFAMLASITPPIALVPAVTCKIADADFLDVALESIKLGLPLFLLPWVFAFNQSLLVLDGLNTVVAFLTTLIGYIILTLGLHGGLDLLRGNRGAATRVALFIGGLVIVFLPAFIGAGFEL